MRQTLLVTDICYFLRVAQAVILLMLTPLLRVPADTRVCTVRGLAGLFAISTNCLNARSCADIFRSDVPPDAWVLISSMLVLAMAFTTVYYRFLLR